MTKNCRFKILLEPLLFRYVRVQPATALIVLDKLKEADKKNSRWESDKRKQILK